MALITLRVLDGADRGRVYQDLPTPVTIGREEGNSIQLNDERVSRFHLKIQEDRDKIVLTDLESTNGTRVNGEDVQLRILRYGDMISVGRSVLLFGRPDQIAERLARLRGEEPEGTGSVHPSGSQRAEGAGSEFDLNWGSQSDVRKTLHALEPPRLPEQLSPAQAAELAELLEYLHIRIRELLETVKVKGPNERVTLEQDQWQNLLDLQAMLAEYLRQIAEPGDSD
jgi:pSer/pThr/pTyr-binding forkhead associated (FHA) protein